MAGSSRGVIHKGFMLFRKDVIFIGLQEVGDCVFGDGHVHILIHRVNFSQLYILFKVVLQSSCSMRFICFGGWTEGALLDAGLQLIFSLLLCSFIGGVPDEFELAVAKTLCQQIASSFLSKAISQLSF